MFPRKRPQATGTRPAIGGEQGPAIISRSPGYLAVTSGQRAVTTRHLDGFLVTPGRSDLALTVLMVCGYRDEDRQGQGGRRKWYYDGQSDDFF